METELVSKVLPQEEVLEKIKEFYSEIQKVNGLYESYLSSKNEFEKETFECEWKKLLQKNSAYFTALSFDDVGWPHKKSIISEIAINIPISQVTLYYPNKNESEVIRSTPRENWLASAKIIYTVNSNQEDSTPGSGFPYFGMHLALVLSDKEDKTILAIAIAMTPKGCNLIRPTFDMGCLTILGKENQILFKKIEDFTMILNFCFELINLIRERLGDNTSIMENFTFC